MTKYFEHELACILFSLQRSGNVWMSHHLNSRYYKHREENRHNFVQGAGVGAMKQDCSPAPNWRCGGWNNTAAARLHSWCRTAQSCWSQSPQSQKCPEHQWTSTEKQEHQHITKEEQEGECITIILPRVTIFIAFSDVECSSVLHENSSR